MAEHVVIVDETGKVLGTKEKQQAHQMGCLHQAFSIFIFNSRQQLMLQQRAWHKYHSGGLWSNTCCSHPRLGESFAAAAHRRLQEEMGFDCPLTPMFAFTYYAQLDKGMIEHEWDQVFFGFSDQLPHINLEEVAAIRFITLPELQQELAQQPAQFTAWFHIVFQRIAHLWPTA